jgi:hypothetical protein
MSILTRSSHAGAPHGWIYRIRPWRRVSATALQSGLLRTSNKQFTSFLTKNLDWCHNEVT